MTSVIYIVLYFGKMRDDFPLWLKTCEYNPTIHWLILTDDRIPYKYPENVKVVYQSFDEAAGRMAEKIGFPIQLETPYKLCDYKPLYGEVFSEYVCGYDFWGHCDLDLLWGDIRKFLTEDIFSKYDKIGFLGHSTLYRNTPEVNARWRCMNGGEVNYIDAFTTSEIMFFDEQAMNGIYAANGWNVYQKQIFADLTDYHYNFYLTNVAGQDAKKNNRQIFYWERGRLLRYYLMDQCVEQDEFMYIHFLKRKMKLDTGKNDTKWMIIPNRITNKVEMPVYKTVKKYSKPRWGKYFLHLFWEKKSKITPFNVVRFIVRRSRKYYALKHKNEALNDLGM